VDEWLSPTVAELRDVEGTVWRLDVTTGELTQR
jgi:hypothetical protein